MSLQGYLVSTDNYYNLQLANTEEYVDGKHNGFVGETLIRFNFSFSIYLN
jgi:small nuclear ribonucleoprotein F